MKTLGSFPHARLAQGFVDFLAGKGVRAVLVPDGDKVQVLVEDGAPGWVEQAWQQFLAEPDHPRYQAASWQAPGDSRPGFRYRNGGRLRLGSGRLTMLVMALCGLIYLSYAMGIPDLYLALLFPPDLHSLELADSYRLFTPILLHFSLLHIAFNLLWWWQLGGDMERRLGTGQLLLLTLVSGFAGNLAQYLATGPNFGGLSGVVYGLMGFFWLSGHVRPERGIQLPQPVALFMLAWLVLGFIGIGLPIANMAHLFGLIAGLMLALLPLGSRRR
ncbi:rhomboid family intramembrane serine protease GlpG [Gallaecimonas sp. GXIMD4217]|uniref:rhomboid family intramembrane serine protease GlpG n=1 Tax=Gallaecimonas sp. GXIMD4217 TaxID=3131927 RepID=UPI00311AF986